MLITGKHFINVGQPNRTMLTAAVQMPEDGQVRPDLCRAELLDAGEKARRSVDPPGLPKRGREGAEGAQTGVGSGSPFGSRANWPHPLPAKMTVGTRASLRWSLLDLALAPGGMGRCSCQGHLAKTRGQLLAQERPLPPSRLGQQDEEPGQAYLGEELFFPGTKEFFSQKKRRHSSFRAPEVP